MVSVSCPFGRFCMLHDWSHGEQRAHTCCHMASSANGPHASQVAAEESWQRLLLTVRQALGSGRRMLWDDAARRLAVLLTAPAAFAAEHFTQAPTQTHSPFMRM